MKKYSYTMLLMLMVLLLPKLNVHAEHDEKTGIEYSISYRTTVDAPAYAMRTDESSPRNFNKLYRTYFADVNYYEINNDLEEYINIIKQQIKDWHILGYVMVISALDGKEFSLDPLSYKFFEVPEKFNGTKEVTKEGILFVVRGDGTGNLYAKVKTDVREIRKVTIKVPTYRDVEVNKKEIMNYSATAQFINVNSVSEDNSMGTNGNYTGTSLREVLDYCKANADLQKPIDISVSQTYEVIVNALCTGEITMYIEYGNTQTQNTVETNKKSNTTQSTQEIQDSITSESPIADNGTEATGETEVQTVEMPENAAVLETEIKEETNKSGADEEKDEFHMASYIAIVIILGSVIGAVICIYRFKKKKTIRE